MINLKQLPKPQTVAIALITIGFTIAMWYGINGGFFHWSSYDVDVNNALKFAPFISGAVVPFFTLAGTILLYVNFQNWYKQQIGTNFFQLLNLHHKIVDGISTSVWDITPGKEVTGRSFFDDLAFRIAIDYNNKSVKMLSEDSRVIEPVIKTNLAKKDRLLHIYTHYYHVHSSDLGHYFRHLYRTVKYIHESSISNEEKDNYIGILRAQLSNCEILLLAYGCMFQYGSDFKPLVIKYQLIRNLSFEFTIKHYGYHERIICDKEILVNEYKEQLEGKYNEQLALDKEHQLQFATKPENV